MSKNAVAAVAESAAADEKPPRRKAPVIEPEGVQFQYEGMVWREVLLRLPADATLQDLNEPGLFRLVQLSQKALIRLDRVTIAAFDESWIVEAVVAAATSQGVTLGGIRKIDLPARTEALYEDENYRVAWTGKAYEVRRKRDDVRVSSPVHSKAQAERDLRQIYSQNLRR